MWKPRSRKCDDVASLPFAVGLVLLIAGCGTGSGGSTQPPTATTPPPTAATAAAACPTPAPPPPNVFSVPGEFPELEQTTYWVDPDNDPCSQLRVLYTIPAAGWAVMDRLVQARGGPARRGPASSASPIWWSTAAMITSWRGKALSSRWDRAWTTSPRPWPISRPFVVTSPPSDITPPTVTAASTWSCGCRLTTDLSKCVNNEVISWDASILSYPFHGYFLGAIEEYWILDVEGTRLVIVAGRAPDSPPGEMLLRCAPSWTRSRSQP